MGCAFKVLPLGTAFGSRDSAMLATVHTGVLHGVDALPVRVEINETQGLPALEVVGLPAGSVRESKVRVKAALASCNLPLPHRRYLVNLVPADLRKTGASFDLAIAAGLLVVTARIPEGALRNVLVLGELSIGGDVLPVRGVLSQLRSANRRGMGEAVVPVGNAREAVLVNAMEVRAVSHVSELIAHFAGTGPLPAVADVTTRCQADRMARAPETGGPADPPDLADVVGQPMGRRALELAAVGGSPCALSWSTGGRASRCSRRGSQESCPRWKGRTPWMSQRLRASCRRCRRGICRPARSGRRTTARHWRRWWVVVNRSGRER